MYNQHIPQNALHIKNKTKTDLITMWNTANLTN